jgi:CubicO group peptidase (beta-lactamase class C family)
MKYLRYCLPLIAAFLLAACATAPELSSRQIDKLVERAMDEFSVPGVAVGVVKDGVVVHARGYGVREIGLAEPVDTETLFRVASTSKAFTAASLAILVDEGLLSWDDKVVDHIPDFALQDPWVTQEFTVADLLTHRSGLAPYAGDLMLWPKPNDFSRADIIHALRHFDLEIPFRTRYAYDNLLYIVAGELVPAVTGVEWQDFVDARIMAPLGATRCFAGAIPDAEMRNVAAPHLAVEGELQVVERNRASAGVDMAAAAGGVRCSVGGMLRWAQLQLARGALPDGSRVFSEEQSWQMWRAHTILHPGREQYERDRTHFRAYGLGWRLADVHGYKDVSHTGSYTGFRAQVTMIPELDLGVVVLLNASAGDARSAIVHGIVKSYMGIDDVDWVEYFAREDEPEAVDTEDEVVEIDFRSGAVAEPVGAYVGGYRDPWFGDVSIEVRGEELWFVSVRSPRMTARLWPYEDHTFYAYWEDRTLEADTWVHFVADESGAFVALEVEQVSEESDWDFTDLALVRVEDE